jgi:hypothetical protein
MRTYTEQEIAMYKTMVGLSVHKGGSRKPFKSGNRVNRVKAADTVHPVTGRLCFTFFEDDSYVECHRCLPVVA